MQDRTVRAMAEELAGIFYEQNVRTPRFRLAFPTFRHYQKGLKVNTDGSITAYRPGYQHHMEQARQMLALMLSPNSKVHPNLKEKIYEGMLADQKQIAQAGRRVRRLVQGVTDQHKFQELTKQVGASHGS